MQNFWQKLKKPVFVLAPMADVTDAAFRRVIAKYGKPDVLWTEFVSADGLVLAPGEGKKKLMIDLLYSQAERPIVAQFFTSSPENMRKAAELARELGFDGVDINMGCPDRSIEKQGAGAALMKNPALARELIRAAKEGAQELPVSIKTRLGYNKVDLSFIKEVLEEGVAMLTVHLRTRKEMSKVSAHWELMGEIVKLRDEISPETVVLGNGDVMSLEEARQRVEETGCDGVMLGRAIFGNPWLFADLAQMKSGSQIERPPKLYAKADDTSIKEKLSVLIQHVKLFEELLISSPLRQGYGGPSKNFAIMKKHFKAYVNGFPGAAELRVKLMETSDAKQVEEILADFLAGR